MLARLNGSKSAVECGTSFGVSTIYLALVISQNVSGLRENAFGVFTVEKSVMKVQKARELWKQAGKDVEDWIVPHQGDLLEILESNDLLPQTVDLLFLDGE
jgi:predicted O-methyltransferase YrrM